jgi:hypothetical protein
MLPLLAAVVLVLALPMMMTVATAFSTTMGQDEDSMRSSSRQRFEKAHDRQRRLSEPVSFPLERQVVFPAGDTTTAPVKQLKVSPPVDATNQDPNIEAIKASLRVCGLIL